MGRGRGASEAMNSNRPTQTARFDTPPSMRQSLDMAGERMRTNPATAGECKVLCNCS
jgi:hypothetical protein